MFRHHLILSFFSSFSNSILDCVGLQQTLIKMSMLEEEEEQQQQQTTATAATVLEQVGYHRIGYALSPKKVDSFIKESLLDHAKQRGILLLPINLHQPLIQQGPFHCILHKLSGHLWNQQLLHYSSIYPHVPIIDPPHAIQRLHDRVSMLQVVTHLQSLTQSSPSFGIPSQVFVHDSQSLLDPTTTLGPLKFPLIAKPLVADGTSNSHHLSLVFNKDGLKGLQPPLVLQQFVNHGGVLFKVYVAGNHVNCVKRRSLPDISDHHHHDKLGMGASHNLLSFSQISNLTHDQNDDDTSLSKLIEAAQMPPVSFVTELANALRNALSLHLFNFDLIRDSTNPNRYLVIDINYFPGYAKMPSYETVLTDFFLDILHRNPSVC